MGVPSEGGRKQRNAILVFSALSIFSAASFLVGSLHFQWPTTALFAGTGFLLLLSFSSLWFLIKHRKSAEELERDLGRERKMVEDLSLFKRSMDRTQLGITITTLDGKILYANPAEASMHGYVVEELIGKDVRVFAPPEFWEVTTTEQIHDIKSWRRESVNLRKDGSTFSVELVSDLVTDYAGYPLGILTTSHDITDRKQVEAELRASKEGYRNLIETAQDIISTISPEGCITSLNLAFETITGWSREEWIGKPFAPLVHPEDLSFATSTFQRIIGGESVPGGDLRVLCKSGEVRTVEFTAVPQIKEGQAIGLLTISRDVTKRKLIEQELRRHQELLEQLVDERTAELNQLNHQLLHEIDERKRVEDALRQSEERYVLALRGAQDGLWDWNLENNEIYFAPQWKLMLGHDKEEIGNGPDEWFNRIHPDDVEKVKVEIFAHLEGLTPHFQNEHRVLHKDGTYRWMLSRGRALRDESGKALRIAGSQTDIAERKRLEQELAQQAFYDPMTHLPNRALFMDRLGQALRRCNRRGDYLFALLYLDLDHFKLVNDTLGHLIGDQLLAAVARKLEECLRPSDTVARFGGDEFTILLDDIKAVGDATQIADRIWQELKSPFSLGGKEVIISASVGITLSSKGYEYSEDLLDDADTAMYRAKKFGQTRHYVLAS